MIDTFMFDLDGTLLPIDMDKFIKIYFDEMGAHFQDIIDPRLLARHIWVSTEAMVQNTGSKTNEMVFMDKFSELIDGNLEEYLMRFDSFYDTGYLKTQEAVGEVPYIRESISILKDKGYDLLIATNPLFPRKAILHRIKWAGLKPEDFTYISCYEKSHYSKPNIRYYEELISVHSNALWWAMMCRRTWWRPPWE